MELKGYKYKTCKTGLHYIYVKSKDQTPEAFSRGGGGAIMSTHSKNEIKTCMYYKDKVPQGKNIRVK